MKSRYLKASLGSVIFLILVIAVIALLHPVFTAMNSVLKTEETRILSNFTEKTGLKIKYDSLSPSILAAINIRGIELLDAENDKKLLEIKKAAFSYRLRDFFSRNPVKAIKLLSLDGVTVEFDAVKDQDIIEKIKSSFVKEKKDEKKTTTSINFKGKTLEIPFNVELKNLSIHYADKTNDFVASIKNILLERSFNSQNGVAIKISGRLEYRTEFLKHDNYRSLCACGFSVSGTYYKNLNGSSFMLRLTENSRADYSISKIELLANYSDDKLTLRTMRSTLPYSLMVEADLNQSTLETQASSRSFDPSRLFKIRNGSSLTEKIAGTKVTGNIEAGCSFAQGKKGLLDSLVASVKGKTELSEKLTGSPLEISLDASCKNAVLTVENFSAAGDKLGAEFNGNLELKKLQPSGVLTLDHLLLKNGGLVQTELYVDPYKNGFMCFAPQFFMDDRSLTAIQLTVLPENTSVDFTFEFDDYSHTDYEKSGHVKVDGSFLTGNEKLIQASASINDIFLDSIMQSALFFVQGGLTSSTRQNASSLSSYIMTDEVYFTTDFKSYSFNSPFFLLANTEKERQLLTLSIDGSNQTISLSNLDLQFGNQTAHATAGIDFNGSFKDFNFYSDLVVNSLPYTFSGSCSNDFLTVSGDYSLNAAFDFADKIDGSIDFSSLPFKAGDNIFAVSSSTSLSWSERNGFELEISSFDIDEPSGKINIKPHLAFTGTANRYGFVFDKLAYSDTSSALDGKGSVVWNLSNGIFESIIFNLNASSLVGSETINLNAQFTNPQNLSMDSKTLQNDFYLSAEGNIKNFQVSRFISEQSKENTITADFSATGTISNPFVTLNVKRSSVNLAGSPAVFTANAVYDDTGLSVSDARLNWNVLKVKDINLFFDPKKFTGNVAAELSGEVCELDFDIPLKAEIQTLSPGKDAAKNFLTQITSEKMSGKFFPSNSKLDLMLTKSTDRIDVISAHGRGITASIVNGQVTAVSGADSPLGFELKGSVKGNAMDISVKNIRSDLKKFCQTVSIPYVHFTEGSLSGALKISGLITDPEYTGAFTVIKPEFTVPYLSKKTFKTDRVFATAGQKSFIVKPTKFTLDKNPVDVGLDIEFDRWGIDYMDVDVLTKKNQYIPMDMDLPFIHYKGYAGFDLTLHLIPGSVTFTGTITGNDSDIEVKTNDLVKGQQTDPDMMDYICDLNLVVNNKVQILLNPLLRGLIVPGSKLEFFLDTSTGEFGAKGDVNLRGGEVAWLNRNFYMKEGRVQFNESNNNFDPRITVRAETRERDDNNNQVTIILSAQNQTLSAFNPKLSASPAKSEKEIMELLGQVISADSENAASLAMAGGDYLMQATVMRSVENALREVLNFDIFSIRTNVLQNAVKQSMAKSANKQMSFSNFFDNSAVYVGKYFGNAMYVDALMHWNYDESKVGDGTSVNGLVFQPEFGLEMESPYVNIRLGVAPDLEAIKNSFWIPSTSITLSWKHSF